MTTEAFGERLRRERRNRKLSQYETAARIEVSQPSYHRWESGEVALASKYRPKLAEFLGITMDEMFHLLDPDFALESHVNTLDLIAALTRRVAVLEDEVVELRKR